MMRESLMWQVMRLDTDTLRGHAACWRLSSQLLCHISVRSQYMGAHSHWTRAHNEPSSVSHNLNGQFIRHELYAIHATIFILTASVVCELWSQPARHLSQWSMIITPVYLTSSQCSVCDRQSSATGQAQRLTPTLITPHNTQPLTMYQIPHTSWANQDMPPITTIIYGLKLETHSQEACISYLALHIIIYMFKYYCFHACTWWHVYIFVFIWKAFLQAF